MSTTELSDHGTINGYFNYGCRCLGCRAAGSAYMKQRRERGSSVTEITTKRPRAGHQGWTARRPGFYTVNPQTNIGNYRFDTCEEAEAARDAIIARYPEDPTPLVVVEITETNHDA